MKKRFGLLIALSTLALSACNFNFGGNATNQQGNESGSNTQQSSSDRTSQLVKVVSSQTFFPEVGDYLDLSTYIEFDEDFAHAASEYTFASSNRDVISIDGYRALCNKEGYATITVTGPGISQPLNLSFYIGSVAGTYLPDSSRLKDLVSFTIGEKLEEGYAFNLTIKEGTYRNKPLTPFNENGVFYKSVAPLLIVDFPDNKKPTGFSPVTSLLTTLGVELPGEIPNNVYGLLSYDEAYGVSIKALFGEDIIEFFAK